MTMKTILCTIGATLLLAVVAITQAISAEKDDASSRVLRHVVAFKFKETASSDQIKQVTDAFRDLKKKIPQIAGFEWGTNNSPEGLNKGFTHAYVLTFKSEKDREIYLPHPDHKAFGKMLGPLLAEVFVIDFWAQP